MKRLIVIATAALLFFSCTSNQFSIKGEIEGAVDQMVFLKMVQDNQLVAVDSTMLKNGEFTFTGKVDFPDLYALDFEHNNDRIILFVENKPIKITGSAENLMSSEIIGSPSHDLLLEFNKLLEELSQPLMEISFRYESAAMDGILTPTLEEELRTEYMAENNKMIDSLAAFAKQNSHSVVSAYITVRHLVNYLSFDKLEGIVAGFPESIQQSPFVDELNNKLRVEGLTAIGKPYVNFSHPDQSGNTIDFSTYIGKNYVLLDFWAGWCAPCRKENPHLVKLYNQYKGKGFDIFGVSLDRTREEWLAAVKDDGLGWIQVSDVTGWENPIAKLYGIQSIPANLLIDPNGIIVAKNLRGKELDEKLAELLD